MPDRSIEQQQPTRLGRYRELRVAAAQASPGAFKVVVAHHPLVRSPLLLGEPAARRARLAAALFADIGVELVLSGHVHLYFLGHSQDFYPHLPTHFRVLHAGTTTSRRADVPPAERQRSQGRPGLCRSASRSALEKRSNRRVNQVSP